MDSSETKAVQVRKSTVALVQDGQRSVSTRGYRFQLYVEHLEDHLVKNEWCDMACHARVFAGRNTEAHRRAARGRLRRVFGQCLDAGMFLVIDYAQRGAGRHGEALQVKLLRTGGPQSAMEQQAAHEQLERMLQRKEITEGRYQRALLLLRP